VILAFDTATPSTVVGLGRGADDLVADARHDPAPGERPGHAAQLLALCERVLAEAGMSWGDLTRLGVGVGPGTFTGLRIGVATARGLAQARGLETVAVPTLQTLVDGPDAVGCLDARRGEVFAAAADRPAVAVAPDGLAAALGAGPWRVRGDGADRYAEVLRAQGLEVEPGARVEARWLVGLAAKAAPATAIEPDYVRAPDAKRKDER
jgi:tRNA threonylcarbamoyladenosine biosynthesis protein TsaB